MRSDGLPWFYDQLWDLPVEESGRSHGNYDIDDFGPLVAQCAWMHQGRYKLVDESEPSIIQMPFALSYFQEGHKLTNYRTGTVYTVAKVIDRYSDDYKEPRIDNTPESILLPKRRFVKSFHPAELTGATLQLESNVWDLDHKQGDFLSIESTNRPAIRQYSAVTRGELSGDNREHSAPYGIEYIVEREQPGAGKTPFSSDVRGVKPTARPREATVNTADPTIALKAMAQTFDNLVAFRVKARNGHELNRLTAWFNRFMLRYVSVFQRVGYGQILYWDRREYTHEDKEVAGTEPYRSLRYYVRTEQMWPKVEPLLRQVDIKLKHNGTD